MGTASGVIRVLLVDDDPDFAEMAARLLEREGERLVVETAGSSSEGVARLDEGAFDCIVADYDLPDEDGISFLQTVREDEPDVPFVLFTGEGSEAVASAALSAEATDYMRKRGNPDQFVELAGRVRTAVDRHRSRVEAERERREREAELAEKSSLLDSIFEQLPAHLFVKDEAARHVRISAAFVDDPTDFIGKTDLDLLDYVSEAHARQACEDDRRVIETGDPVIDKEEYLRKRDQWNLTSKVPWRDEDGDTVGLIGISWDITERKEHEEQIVRQKERLEEFARIVSHDLRNPMTVAQGNLEYARETGSLDPLDDALGALDRMNDIIERTLTLARDGRRIGDVEPVPLEAAALSSWGNVTSADAELEFDVDGTVVLADPERLRHLFENLFSNAIEHAGPDVTIVVGDLADGFSVADDGPGIPPDERERVFETGYSGTADGTGFGLSIVRQVVDAHGWDVAIEESEDGGARFEITGVDVEG